MLQNSGWLFSRWNLQSETKCLSRILVSKSCDLHSHLTVQHKKCKLFWFSVLSFETAPHNRFFRCWLWLFYRIWRSSALNLVRGTFLSSKPHKKGAKSKVRAGLLRFCLSKWGPAYSSLEICFVTSRLSSAELTISVRYSRLKRCFSSHWKLLQNHVHYPRLQYVCSTEGVENTDGSFHTLSASLLGFF